MWGSALIPFGQAINLALMGEPANEAAVTMYVTGYFLTAVVDVLSYIATLILVVSITSAEQRVLEEARAAATS